MIVLIMALLNRARGDDRWMPDWLPGRALWYVTPLVAGAAIVQTGSAAAGAIWALGYLLWAIPSWGHLIGMGRFMPDRAPGRLESALLGWGLNQVHSLTTATRAIADKKFCASRSYLVAIRRQFFSLQKRRSMTLRLL